MEGKNNKHKLTEDIIQKFIQRLCEDFEPDFVMFYFKELHSVKPDDSDATNLLRAKHNLEQIKNFAFRLQYNTYFKN